MARPGRVGVAIIGDGSAASSYQTLWTAASQNVGVPFIILENGRYQAMDALTGAHGTIPWPGLEHLSAAGIAEAMGVRAVRVTTPAAWAGCSPPRWPGRAWPWPASTSPTPPGRRRRGAGGGQSAGIKFAALKLLH